MATVNQGQTARHAMPAQDPAVRAHNFNEVALGYTHEMAVEEALRCIQCRRPLCITGCPVQVRIPEFIKALREGDMWQSVAYLKDHNSLPAICGRVCPQETQCEQQCVLGRRGEPVAIGRLERFVADWERQQGIRIPEVAPSNGKRVAIVGSGPAGLTAAGDLAKKGYQVDMLEALHAAGGVLIYGIPEFRLPKSVVAAEIDYVKQLGVNIRQNIVIGKLYTMDELLQEYDAIFLGTGAGLPIMMNIPGENLNGVYSANEFLTRVNLMKAFDFPNWDTPVRVGERVAVVGAGNVAMDAARCSLRLGAREVHIVYRRSRDEVPARAEEVEHAEEEGVIFDFLTNPVAVLGNEQGTVAGLRCIRMALGEPDESGRRRPVPEEGSEFELAMDTVIMALGTRPNPLVFTEALGLQRSRQGTVVADHTTGRTTQERVWAGGDIVTGAATVISAMGAGRVAANDIDAYLSGGCASPWAPEEN
ncbi:MAG: NADPH-dependent glutamate synthase [Anaerolineae bacterium]|jgi:glutamate synthase (NADPH/NADH) small chain|nr:NADPH-dependent glutamate synthase [Chloroflexota bacterium]